MILTRDNLKDQLISAIKDPLPGQLRLRVLRMIKEIVNSRESSRPKSQPVTDPELTEIIKNMISQRERSIERYQDQEDWIHREKAEIEILTSFLPKPKLIIKEKSKEEKDKVIRARLKQFRLNPEMRLIRAIHENLVDHPDITIGDIAKTLQAMISEKKKEQDELYELYELMGIKKETVSKSNSRFAAGSFTPSFGAGILSEPVQFETTHWEDLPRPRMARVNVNVQQVNINHL